MPVSPEKYLLSSIIRNADMKTAAKVGITADMFHNFPEEWAFIEAFYLKHKKTPSKIVFRDKFPKFSMKAVDDTGHFADEVRKAHSRYMMTTMMSDAADLIAEGKIEEAVTLAHINMGKIGAALGTSNDSDIIKDFDDVLADVERRVERVKLKGRAGVPTGFPTLDDRTGGPQPGNFWVVAARLGEGKSWTMQRMATAAVMNGYRVQYDALEQTRAEVSMRVHAFLASSVGMSVFQTSDLMRGQNFDIHDYKNFLRKLKKKIKGDLHVSDTSRGRVGIMTVRSQIERNHPDIVFIDYLGLMEKKGFDHQDYAALSGGCKASAGEYEVPFVVANQLNRSAGMGNNPGADALSGSDAIGQDADLLLFMKQTSPHTQQLMVPKNRNGEGGFKFYCQFDPGNGVYEEVGYERWQDLKDIDADNGTGKKRLTKP